MPPAGRQPGSQRGLLLMDFEMPGIGGIAATAVIESLLPDVPVVMLTAFEDAERILAAIRAGADGYLLKRSDPSEILEEVRNIAAGGPPLTPSVARSILAHVRSGHPPAAEVASKSIARPVAWNLSERDLDILHELIEGIDRRTRAAEAISRATKSGVVLPCHRVRLGLNAE